MVLEQVVWRQKKGGTAANREFSTGKLGVLNL
jgi:hypothetical protein